MKLDYHMVKWKLNLMQYIKYIGGKENYFCCFVNSIRLGKSICIRIS